MAKKKVLSRRRARSHPVTKQELVENNPATAEAVMKRFSPLQKTLVWIAGGVAGLVAIGQVWAWFGAKTVVWDRDLAKVVSEQNISFENKLGTVKAEVNTKIDSTKNEVVGNQNAIKTEITGSLNELTKTLGTISKSQNASAIESAEMATKLAFTQLQSLQGQLATVKLALQKDQNDTMLQTRVLQLETFIKQNERDMQDAKDKIARLRNGQ